MLVVFVRLKCLEVVVFLKLVLVLELLDFRRAQVVFYKAHDL